MDFILCGELLHHKQIVSWYLTQHKIPFAQRSKYDTLSWDALEDLIKKEYKIKGEFTLVNLQKAKKIDAPESEHDLQVRVVKYLEERKIAHFAVPNGFFFNGDKVTSARYLNYMKSEGLRPGVFDLVLLPGNDKVAFLEMKTPTGKPSEHQLRWQKWYNANNYNNRICYGYDEAIDFIEEVVNGKGD